MTAADLADRHLFSCSTDRRGENGNQAALVGI